jgi:DHA1 family multidrug resistance protein-like MFS transporter
MTGVTSRPPVSWIRLLALFTAAGFVETVFFGQLNAFTPLYLPRLGIAPLRVPTWTGALAAVSMAVGIPFLPFWGALADRYARQPIIVRSFVAHLGAAVGMLLAGNIWVFVIGRSLTSMALGCSGLMMTTLSEHAPQHRLGLAFSIMNAAPPVGAFVGPLLSGPLVDAWGFPALLLIDSILMLIVILALTFGYRDTFRGTNRGPLLSTAVESVRFIWNSGRLRALFTALFLLFAGWMLAMTYAPLAIMALYHGEEPGTAVGAVLGAGGLTALVLSPILGALADRFGHWRALFGGAAVAVLLWPLPLFAPELLSFGIAWALINGLVSAVFAVSFTVLSTSAPSESRGRVMSFAYLPVNVGYMVGPAIGSVVTRGSVFAIFPTAAVLTALGIGVVWIAARQAVEGI